MTLSQNSFHWGPANVGAVWIEDENHNYIKTLEYWADQRIMSLFWLDRICQPSFAAEKPDIITSATLPNHTKLHS